MRKPSIGNKHYSNAKSIHKPNYSIEKKESDPKKCGLKTTELANKLDRRLLVSHCCNKAILKKSFAGGKSAKKQGVSYHKRNKTEPQLETLQINRNEDKDSNENGNNCNSDDHIFQSFLHSINILNEIQKHLELSVINNSIQIPHQPLKNSMIEKKITPLYPTHSINTNTKAYTKSMIVSIPSSKVNKIRFYSSNNINSSCNQKSPKRVISELTKQKLLNEQLIASDKRKQKYLDLFDKINHSVGLIRECIMINDREDIIKEEIGNWDFSESGFTESLLKQCSKDTINYCDDLLDEHSRINSPQLIVTQSNNIKEHHKQISSINHQPSKTVGDNKTKNITTIHSNVSTAANNKNEGSIGAPATITMSNENKDTQCVIL